MKQVRSAGQRAFSGALAVGALALLSPASADAHFILRTPASWMSQNSLGDPQKQGPCGIGAGGTPTGSVTAVQAGQTITISIDETIFHPGHYRIALAVNDRSELPPEPVVTPGSTPCGSVAIQNPPVFPVLADGVLLHTRPFSGRQTIQVTLPPDVTCEHCTLQILEFMSEHGLNVPGGCFYHHCADLSIASVTVADAGAAPVADAGADVGTATPRDAGGAPLDAGTTSVADAGGALTTSSNGCSCGVARSESRVGLGLVALAGLCALGRRRRPRR
jgi:MYXO-CTERM domain-containing protein